MRPNMPNMANYAKYAKFAKYAKYAKYAYLGDPDMVKWGIPEKILQNAVQTRWS